MFRPVMHLLTVCTLFLIGGCESRSDHIHYLVPNGFRGKIVIYVNQPDGVSLKKTNGRFTCVIPDDGVLRISDKGPFFEWHETSASFINGDPIAVADEPERLSESQVAFWSHGCGQKGDGPLYVYDFIGTKAENEAFCRASETGKVIPGGIQHNKTDD